MPPSPRSSPKWSGRYVASDLKHNSTDNTYTNTPINKQTHSGKDQNITGTGVLHQTIQPSKADPHPSDQGRLLRYMDQLNKRPN